MNIFFLRFLRKKIVHLSWEVLPCLLTSGIIIKTMKRYKFVPNIPTLKEKLFTN